jgi:hypothetical protein
MLTVEKTTDKYLIPIRSRYVFCEMIIGDCMFFEDFKNAESARVAAIQYVRRKNLQWKFSIRKMNDGWRLFRVI